MVKRRLAVYAFSASLVALNPASIYGQNYPSRPIRMVTVEAGGGADVVVRLITPALANSLGQQIVVDNRGGSILSGQIVARAVPDGYTLLFNGGTLWISPLLQAAPYDPLKDFAPITLVASAPNLLVVHPSLPVKSVKDLIALAKARPGQLNYASGVTGAPTQIAMELFKSMTGVDIVRIPYKGSGPALNSLIGGHEQMMVVTASSGATVVHSGRLRALAVTSAQPSALFPGMPTVAETVPGYESSLSFGLLGPAGTPSAIINRLNLAVAQAVNDPATKERLLGASLEISGGGPERITATMKSETSRMSKVIKDAGIKAE